MPKGLQGRSLAGSCCSKAFGRQGGLVVGTGAVIRILDSAPVLKSCLFEFGFGTALLEAVVGSVVGLLAQFSSYDPVSLPQHWGVWLIALSLPLVFVRIVQYNAISSSCRCSWP